MFQKPAYVFFEFHKILVQNYNKVDLTKKNLQMWMSD